MSKVSKQPKYLEILELLSTSWAEQVKTNFNYRTVRNITMSYMPVISQLEKKDYKMRVCHVMTWEMSRAILKRKYLALNAF